MEKYRTHINKHFDEYVAELQDFCRQLSISNTGEGMSDMAQMVQDRLARLGVSPDTIIIDKSYPYFFVELGEGRRTLLIYDHYDVQPVNSENWSVPPFGAEIRQHEGRRALFARGVADNKANLLFRIQAVDSYLKTHGRLPLRVKFLIEGEEEIGSPHLPALVAQHGNRLRADGCIWESGRKDASGRPLLCLGLKGIVYFELAVRTANSDIHSSWGTLLPNAAWRLTQALSTLRDESGRVAIDGLDEHVQPPTEADLAMLEALPFSTEPLRATYGLRNAPSLDGVRALARHLFEPALNICGMISGHTSDGVKTILPNEARAKLDMRLPPGLMPDVVMELLRAHLDRHGFKDIEIVFVMGEPPAKSPLENPLAEAVISAARETYGVEPAVWPLMAASGPMYYLCDSLGTPGITFGAGHEGDNIHGADEHIFLDNYRQALEGFGEILTRFASEDIS